MGYMQSALLLVDVGKSESKAVAANDGMSEGEIKKSEQMRD